jgi:hypothetical protein
VPNIGAPELLIVLTLLVAPLLGVVTLIDIARRSDAQFTHAGQSRMTWLIVAILSVFVPCVALGSLYYLVAVRPKLSARP